jgi:hypothetical protein
MAGCQPVPVRRRRSPLFWRGDAPGPPGRSRCAHAALRRDGYPSLHDPAARNVRVMHELSRPENQRAQATLKRGRRESRVPAAPVAPCAKCRKHTSSHHRFTGTPGLPCAMVLTAYCALSPATNSSCHRHRRIGHVESRSGSQHLRRLDTSNGCQDHTVLPSAAIAVRPRALTAHGSYQPALPSCRAPGAAASTAFRPAFVTIAKRPSWGTERRGCRSVSTRQNTGIFLRRRLDRPNHLGTNPTKIVRQHETRYGRRHRIDLGMVNSCADACASGPHRQRGGADASPNPPRRLRE